MHEMLNYRVEVHANHSQLMSEIISILLVFAMSKCLWSLQGAHQFSNQFTYIRNSPEGKTKPTLLVGFCSFFPPWIQP